ncbi:LCP family protein [Blautia faecicola]|uniref:LytR family transcriptional regulator n=1 Tax=Blautia faecicola TaxID=2509240 RepID=A0A4Q1RG31_9FIRM|nr:LCP family protein [Blautia faecicola]RXS74522.1 LytR family transcriptional regulator [Blautia faecicola]
MAKKKPLTKKQKRILQRRRRRRILFGIEIFLLLILIGGVFIYAKLGKMNFTDLDFSKIGVNTGVSDNNVMKGYTTIGLIGLDGRDGELKSGARSDTMIIASINNDTKKVKLVSVYRDTYLRIGEDSEGNGQYNKANAAYAEGGPEQFLSMLNTNLDLNVTDFVSVDFQAVAEAVELLGGIDVELKEEEVVHLNNYCVGTSKVTGMDYTPLEEKAGVHHLNGVQTVSYARIRYTSGNDFRRAARQREVIYKIVEKAKNSDIATLSKILDKVFPKVYTSFTKAEILQMGMSMMSYDIEDQTGFPFDHLYGERVKDAMGGLDVVLPVTLESNVIKLHEFLYPEDSYTPSDEVKAYSQRIVDKSGFGDESRLDHSEDGSLAAYRTGGTE